MLTLLVEITVASLFFVFGTWFGTQLQTAEAKRLDQKLTSLFPNQQTNQLRNLGSWSIAEEKRELILRLTEDFYPKLDHLTIIEPRFERTTIALSVERERPSTRKR
jgi:hypothetical protein